MLVSFWTALGQLLPLIVGAVISPLPIAVVVATLVTPDGLRNGMLKSGRRFLVAHSAVIMVVLFSVLAATNLSDGLSAVLG